MALCRERHEIFDKGIGGCTALLSLEKLQYIDSHLNSLDLVKDPQKLFLNIEGKLAAMGPNLYQRYELRKDAETKGIISKNSDPLVVRDIPAICMVMKAQRQISHSFGTHLPLWPENTRETYEKQAELVENIFKKVDLGWKAFLE